MERTIKHVVETLKNQHKGCTLLIGAGCSQKAGIPTASEFVEIIQQRYPQAYRDAVEKTYPYCMARLSLGQRRSLISEFIKSAKINWAHLGIAQLIQDKFVDRVLTTNFDPLVARSCALVNVFPSIYDFAASQHFKPAYISNPAVFHLHGQHTGFVLLNTPEECERLSKSLAPVFEDAGQGRTWIVVGYSGENDPVFEHLAKVPLFEDNLFWIGFKDGEPAKHVKEKLLSEDKCAYFVRGFDADDFFVTLAQELRCFPPDFVHHPFTQLNKTLGMLTPFTIPGQSTYPDGLKATRETVEKAAKAHEKKSDLAARFYMMAGDFQKVISMEDEKAGSVSSEIVAWALVMAASVCDNRAVVESGSQADKLFAEAYSKFARALKIMPKMHEALNNWGVALSHQAARKSGKEADKLFSQTYEKFARALKIKPDKYEALNNWGGALSDQARTKKAKEADKLLSRACEKLASALKIRPDSHKPLCNWGVALSDQARARKGKGADKLFSQAYDKYASALKIKADYHQALYLWGDSLTDQARAKKGKRADVLFSQAYGKYASSLKIKPDELEALNNWGIALTRQARTKKGKKADKLFSQAYEKYASALKIKPDKQETLYNWGLALTHEARTKKGKEADTLFSQACDKYASSLKINPEDPDALCNWGNVLSEEALAKRGKGADVLFSQAYDKYASALKIQPDCREALHNWGIALADQARTKKAKEAKELRILSKEKMRLAASVKKAAK
jgi:cytochrome c-type biogenesis protein CcmH/NrfG